MRTLRLTSSQAPNASHIPRGLAGYLGTRLGHSEAWMVGLLFVGVAVSFYNLYRFLFEEMSE